MHVKPLTKGHPAKAQSIAMILDMILQFINVVEAFDRLSTLLGLNKEENA